jgi:small subunit ribosomal protein S27Ae
MKKREIYKVEGGKIVRQRKHCPRCGEGIYLAEHKDRVSCGACGYTEFKGKHEKPTAVPTHDRTAEKEHKKPKEEDPTENMSPPSETPSPTADSADVEKTPVE